MNFTLHIWRQKGPNDAGRMVEYAARDVSPETSFLEMLDEVNEAALGQRRGNYRLRVRLP